MAWPYTWVGGGGLDGGERDGRGGGGWVHAERVSIPLSSVPGMGGGCRACMYLYHCHQSLRLFSEMWLGFICGWVDIGEKWREGA